MTIVQVRILQRLPYYYQREIGGTADTVDLKSTALGHEGSNPSFPTIFGLLAQLVEQGTFNPKVWGSIPQQSTKNMAA